MSVNPDGFSGGMGIAEEFVDLEHQVIKQNIDLVAGGTKELLPGEEGSQFEPGERQLDREEVAQLVLYRRSATVSYQGEIDAGSNYGATSVDASMGINSDLFREVTTNVTVDSAYEFDTGGEIGLLDNYEVNASAPIKDASGGVGAGSTPGRADLELNYSALPTGGPIVDSFDTITCGFAAQNSAPFGQSRIELRYDFWWDVAEQGRQTNPFGRPSTR
jgi:hypothetical protein